MIRENALTVGLANLARLPFRLASRKAFQSPRKALILKPCCVSQVMIATPLLAALSDAFPEAQFDWAVSQWARPAIAGNPRLHKIVDTGQATMPEGRWSDVQELIGRLSQEQYDTCFVPSRSSLLSYIAWRSGIDQRVGLNLNGRGFAHTIPVRTVNGRDHESEIYLSLARAVGVEQETGMEFYATDSNRTAVMARLLNMTGWEGVMPLLVMHPGGGNNPISRDERKQWPLERFSLLAGRLARKFGAHVLLVGAEEERRLVESVAGLMSTPVVNLAGQMSLSELGALCDVADLYVGNDAGPTHIAAAVGCPTLAIFGPSDPAISGPFATKGEVIALRPEPIPQPFSWKDVVTVDEAMKAAEKLLGARLGINRVGPLVTAGD